MSTERPHEPRSAEYLLGQIDGRMEAMEGRVDRLEASTARELTAINSKLDMIQAAIARTAGEHRMAGAVGIWARWGWGTVLALAGWAAGYFHAAVGAPGGGH